MTRSTCCTRSAVWISRVCAVCIWVRRRAFRSCWTACFSGASRRAVVRCLCILWLQRTIGRTGELFALDALGKRPFLTAGMHLGEGTGAAAGVALWT
ncbi:MAG: nicotinate-nucleotide--dimethylbenzimidazole phosphoribosyltransferase [Butyricicoccus sp.]